MNVFYVRLHALARTGKPIWLFFETDAPNVADLARRLDAGKFVTGYRLFWRPGELHGQPAREVTHAEETTLCREDVRSISTPSGGPLYRTADEVDDA